MSSAPESDSPGEETVDIPSVLDVQEIPEVVPCLHCGRATPASPTEEQILKAKQARKSPHPVVNIPPTGIALEEIERQALIEAMKMSNWIQTDAADLLNISPRVMNYKMKTLGIEYPPGLWPGKNRKTSRR